MNTTAPAPEPLDPDELLPLVNAGERRVVHVLGELVVIEPGLNVFPRRTVDAIVELKRLEPGNAPN